MYNIQSSTSLPMLTVADFSLPHHVIIRNGETICNSCCCETVILQQSTKITSQNVSVEGDFYTDGGPISMLLALNIL